MVAQNQKLRDAEAVRLIALQLVINSRKTNAEELDPDYQLRRILRWYSKNFSTPLDRVEELPLCDVLLHFWESHYEEMNDQDLEIERQASVEDPEVLAERQRLEDESDMEVYEMAAEERALQLKEAKENAVKKLEDAAQALRSMSEKPLVSPPDKDPDLVMTPVTELRAMPADTKIEFASEDLDLDQDPMSFGLLDPPKK